MKRNPTFVYKVCLALSDILVFVLAVSLAYYLRIWFDPRPFYFEASTLEFLKTIAVLSPLWFVAAVVCGLYNRLIYIHRPRLYGRLLLASGIGIMALISYEFFAAAEIFPVRPVAIYALITLYLLLIISREFLAAVRRFVLRHGRGLLNMLIIGNNDSSYILADYLRNNTDSGYQICAVVAQKKYIPKYLHDKKFSSLDQALKATTPDVIVQTEELNTEKIYAQAVNHHTRYMFVPNQDILISHMGDMDIIGSQPVITVSTTPLVGRARLIKRLSDIIFGLIFLTLASPFMLIIALLIKINEPRGKVLFRQKRLSRYGQTVGIYKFRSISTNVNGLSPEKAFAKLGQPELGKIYRDSGDQLDNDPRFTSIGRILRQTSLDELPQLFNVIKGDISLVGPRALVQNELNKYPDKNLILMIKSGLTGLAQVSGRRNISFEERRRLDVYYIQNWSLLLDIQIILRTVLSVLLRRGAK
ncbi:MAG: sugar transferase [Candidatus Nomurabacteria bacterium]|jgi:exopolysaccharide biosynthesis polyprenyl glycosylphosphotransferase|nr:sugar transferase [Candidatus Nomurabacteria bacterium]